METSYDRSLGTSPLNQEKLTLGYLLCSTEVPCDIYQEYVSQIHGYRW